MAQQTTADQTRTELTTTDAVLALTEGDEIAVEYESKYAARGNTQELTGTITSRTVYLQPTGNDEYLDVEFNVATEGTAADKQVEVSAAQAGSLMVDVNTARRAHDTRTGNGGLTSRTSTWSSISRAASGSVYTQADEGSEDEAEGEDDEAPHQPQDAVEQEMAEVAESMGAPEQEAFQAYLAEEREAEDEAEGEGRLMTDGGTEQKMDYERVCELVEDGVNTNSEITEALDSSIGHVGRVLKRWNEEGKLQREKVGHAYQYSVPDEGDTQAQGQQQGEAVAQAAPAPTPGDAASSQQGGDALRAPVDRDYDWSSYVPSQDEVAEYISHNGEKQEIQVELQAIRQWVENVEADLREELGEDPSAEEITSECRRREQDDTTYAPRLPRFMVDGPTGCGKTTLAEFIAALMGWPVLEIQFTYDMSPAELLGSPQLVGGNTVWEDGGLTKALLASREGPVVLILDEVPRARPEVHSTLMDALDHRARVKLAGRGHEEIQGVPHNLVTVATANLGDEYQHFEMDPAHKRRLGDRHSVDYLGVNYPHREADLVADRTGCPSRLSDLLVEVANQVRERSDDPTSDVRFGVPTAAIIDWAQKARSLAAHDLEGVEGVENPVVKAGESTVVRRWYDGNQTEADTVRQIVKDNLDGCPYDSEDLAAWAGDQEYVVCTSCEYQAPVSEAEGEGVLDFMECPADGCDAHVERKTSQEMGNEDRL